MRGLTDEPEKTEDRAENLDVSSSRVIQCEGKEC